MQRVQLWAAGFHRTEGLHWDSTTMQGSPFKYFSYGAAATEVEVDGFTGAYRVRRVDIVHDVGDSLSPLVDIGQVEGAFVQGAGWLTLEDLRWDESDSPTRGRLATGSASTYKLPSLSEMPDDFRVALLERAHEDGAVYGSKAVGEPPLMLAFSVREALRQAAAAFGPPGVAVDLASPATPEAVFWAVEQARGGAVPPGPAARRRGCPRGRPRPARRRCAPARAGIRGASPRPPDGGPDVHWLTAVERLRATREPGVLVTLARCAGTPRATPGRRWSCPPAPPGAASAAATSNRRRSRGPGGCSRRAPPHRSTSTSPSVTRRAPSTGGSAAAARSASSSSPWPWRPSSPSSAWATSVTSSRASSAATTSTCTSSTRARSRWMPAAMPWLADAVARVQVHHAPLPEMVLDAVPPGTHVLVMTHDRAEDHALCDAALRCPHLGSIGLIGSSAKWSRFERRLTAEGHPADVVARIRTPIGVPDLDGKEPATIAVAVAADLLRTFFPRPASSRPHPLRSPGSFVGYDGHPGRDGCVGAPGPGNLAQVGAQLDGGDAGALRTQEGLHRGPDVVRGRGVGVEAGAHPTVFDGSRPGELVGRQGQHEQRHPSRQRLGDAVVAAVRHRDRRAARSRTCGRNSRTSHSCGRGPRRSRGADPVARATPHVEPPQCL